MKTLKNQKGITLVALVITIIVLLILAGISLSLVMGDNGILGRATKSSAAQKAAVVKDRVELDVANLAADYYQAKYVNNQLASDDTILDYIADVRGIEDNFKFDTTDASDNYDGYDVASDGSVMMYVKNADGNTMQAYAGTLDENGKWIVPIDITTPIDLSSPTVPPDPIPGGGPTF